MKNRYLLIFIAFIASIAQLQAQTANEIIGDLINRKDYFELDKQYPELKDDLHPMLSVMSEALLNSYFNRPEEAVKSIEKLIANYQQDMQFNNTANMLLLKAQQLASIRKYDEAAELLNGFIDQVKDFPFDSDELLKPFISFHEEMTLMRIIPPLELTRPEKDCEIPMTLKKVAGDAELMFIPVTLNGKQSDFIFDTGCGGGAFVSERFARENNIRIIRDSLLIAGTGYGYAKLGFADSIQVGELVLKNVTFTIGEVTEADSVYQIDAVLGTDIMKAAGEVRIYPDEGKIVFPYKETVLPPTGRNLLFDSNQPYLKAFSGDERFIFHFDTGNAGSSLYPLYYYIHKEEIESTGKKDNTRLGGFGGIKYIPTYILPLFSFQVGDTPCTMKNMEVHTKDILTAQEYSGALGMSFIKLFKKTIINFRQMFVQVE